MLACGITYLSISCGSQSKVDCVSVLELCCVRERTELCVCICMCVCVYIYICIYIYIYIYMILCICLV